MSVIVQNSNPEEITISTEEYEILVHRSRYLDYLEMGGVDNWDGFDFAMDAAREDGFFDEDED